MEHEEKKKQPRRIIFPILISICLLGMVVSAYKLISIAMEYRQGEKEYDVLKSYTTQQQPGEDEQPENVAEGAGNGSDAGSGTGEQASDKNSNNKKNKKEKKAISPIAVDFENLKKINLDICGWIYIPVLDLSYPIVQGTDNNQYLHRTFEGTENFAGSIFVDAQVKNPFKDCHTIVYGHNMKNQTMFGKLKLLPQNDLYKQNPVFWIMTPNGDQKYQIFNIGYTDATSDIYTIFSDSGEEFQAYVNNIMASAGTSQEGVPAVNADSRIVTLSTCVAAEGTERLVVQGILIQE